MNKVGDGCVEHATPNTGEVMFRVLVASLLAQAAQTDVAPADTTDPAIELLAQAGPQVLVAGRPITGELGAGDEVLRSGEYVTWYTLDGVAGQTVTLAVSSSDFDTYVMLRGPGVSLDNDDSGDGSTNSLLEATLTASGSYQVGVTSYRPGEVGTYTLALNASTGLDTTPESWIAQGTLELGGIVESGLDNRDSRDARGARVETWELAASEGDLLTITLRSPDFDTWLEVTDNEGFAAVSDDAPGLGTNSRVSFVAPHDGSYLVAASAYDPAARGAYNLHARVDSADGGAPMQVTAQARGADGALEAGDNQLQSGEFYDQHEFSASAGERVTIELSSSEFDTYLILRGPETSIDNDDVADGNTNSQIVTTLPASGDYRVLVTSYAPGETGAYTLNVETAGGDAPSFAGGADLEPGEALGGSWSANDPVRAGGQPFQTFTFNGNRGDRVTIDLESDAVDSWLALRAPSGMEETNDDRGDGTLHSRVATTLRETGAYTVVASTYAAQAYGSFVLSMNSGITSSPLVGSVELDPNALAIGSEQSGSLQQGDAALGTGEFFDTYAINGTEGLGVTLAMSSSEFDTYLFVRGPNGFALDNDDAGGGTNSSLDVTFPVDGVYTVTATSYAPGEVGRYSLRIDEGTTIQRNAVGRVYAVFAGITDYVDASPLPFCAEDAVKLEESLDSTGLLAQQSIVLTNDEVTVRGLERAFERVAERAGPDDMFLFFYSGHGTQIANSDELDGFDEALALYDGTVTDDQLNTWMESVNARVSIIALDSCFSGGFARDVISEPNRMGIFSSEEDVTSNVAARFNAGGYLSYFLRSAMEGAADVDPADGVITAGELTQYLRRQWAQNLLNEAVETSLGEFAYQNLVVERGEVKVSDVILYGLPLGASGR